MKKQVINYFFMLYKLLDLKNMVYPRLRRLQYREISLGDFCICYSLTDWKKTDSKDIFRCKIVTH